MCDDHDAQLLHITFLTCRHLYLTTEQIKTKHNYLHAPRNIAHQLQDRQNEQIKHLDMLSFLSGLSALMSAI